MNLRGTKFPPILWLTICLPIVDSLIKPSIAADEEDVTQVESANFRIALPVSDKRFGQKILEMAESARKTVLVKIPQAMAERIGLIWCPTEREFYARIGGSGRGGQLLAVAVPSMRRVYLNGEQLRRLDLIGLRQALIHEFVHVYVGGAVRKPLPRWLDEGLAMYVAGEWDLGNATALATSGLFGGLLPIESLTYGFPSDATGLRKAYRQSYSMTAYLVDLRYPNSGISGLIADLVKDESAGIRSLLSDPTWLKRFEQLWFEQWVRPGQVTLVVTSSGTLWIVVTFLFLCAYLRKRRVRGRREAQWALEAEFSYHDDVFDD
ncbi:hypothetical protein FJY63_05650 [Candidatus Sumerlaeota bacterium]|nr:hypothetical protein [Candidatus Sumerlaeota bacterium]